MKTDPDRISPNQLRRDYPQPGDLIEVVKSEWYALSDGQKLRVCEDGGWTEKGVEIFTAPRHAVNSFWGPNHGAPDGIKPEYLSTSGGPFNTLKLADMEGLEHIGEQEDRFWCWQDRPRAGGGRDRNVVVQVWRLPLLIDKHCERVAKATTIFATEQLR